MSNIWVLGNKYVNIQIKILQYYSNIKILKMGVFFDEIANYIDQRGPTLPPEDGEREPADEEDCHHGH